MAKHFENDYVSKFMDKMLQLPSQNIQTFNLAIHPLIISILLFLNRPVKMKNTMIQTITIQKKQFSTHITKKAIHMTKNIRLLYPLI
jgi:hypothetical protein